MNNRKPSNRRNLPLLLFLIAGLFLLLNSSCTKITYSFNATQTTNLPDLQANAFYKWLDWNIVFKPGTTTAQTDQYTQTIRDYIKGYIANYNTVHGTNVLIDPNIVNCPCDPLLFNINAEPIMGSGSSIKPPPPTIPPGTGGSGDLAELFINNTNFKEDTVYENVVTGSPFSIKPLSVSNNKILAVMDTGLDPDFLTGQFRNLLWSEPEPAITLRNFLFFSNGHSKDYFMDDNVHKHGTGVTALALEAIQNSPRIAEFPRVMILKVLDADNAGSTFTFSCAMKYAIIHQATLVNASLGYYTRSNPDPIMEKYLTEAATATPMPVPIIAAAGNVLEPHVKPLCSPGPPGMLNPGRLFFPACLSATSDNIISVTGLSSLTSACYYQNYSSIFVRVGVLSNIGSTTNCCAFPISFLSSGATGSSFATPIVSGKIMGCLLTTPGSTTSSCLTAVTELKSATTSIVKDGRILPYTSP